MNRRAHSHPRPLSFGSHEGTWTRPLTLYIPLGTVLRTVIVSLVVLMGIRPMDEREIRQADGAT
uniref:Uncharacterized protein n=1 Tax=uncultured Acidobacteriota bacterium TaxID=171953 RepID=H5S9C6_9BACT|nr:hypothetical protein HGMM_F03C01C03 [uncultured Acidobacteriota bacterium]